MERITRLAIILLISAAAAVPAYAARLHAELTWDTPEWAAFKIADTANPGDYNINASRSVNAFFTGSYTPLYPNTVTITEVPEGGYGPVIADIDPIPPLELRFTVSLQPRFSFYTVPQPTLFTLRLSVDGQLVTQVQLLKDAYDGPALLTEYPSKPTFTFDLNGNLPDAKILLHRYETNDSSGVGGYFSANQEPVAETARPRFRLTGALNVDGVGADRQFWVRLIDPPDKSAYVSTAQPHDNVDGPGRLFYLDDHGQSVYDSNGILPLRSNMEGVNGRVVLHLETTDHAAGDNYQVEASFDPAFTCSTAGPFGGDICPKSVVVVAWKRLYLEPNPMARSSEILTDPAPAGSTSVFVNDKQAFRVGDHVILIHAPSYARTEISDAAGFYEEAPNAPIADVRRSHDPNARGRWEIVLGSPLQSSFYVDPSSNATLPLGDAIVNTSRNPANAADPFFRVDLRYVQPAFADAFVDVHTLPIGTPIPHYDQMTDSAIFFIGRKWMTTRTSAAIPSNHGALFAAQDKAALTQQGSTSLGTTVGASSFVWVQTIEDATAPRSHTLLAGHMPVKVAAEIAVHELAHQWHVNPTRPQGECAERAFDNVHFCQMNTPANNGELDDDVVVFHYHGSTDSEYFDIRTAIEPRP